jgi:arsenite/tail-anchored protein-transporting ATPase
LKRLLPLRVVLITGKGGVGKTTVAASLARYVAAQGKRVLCAEIASDADVASPLADAVGAERLTESPVDIAPNLRAVLLTPTLGHQKFLRDVLPMNILADAAMRSAAIRRFLTAAPTFPELGVLYRLLDLVRAKRRDGEFEHEMIIVDLPATGHALALAQIPSSLLKIIPTGPIAAAVREGLELLTDATRTGTVVVTLPETLPVSEALELIKGLREHQVPLSQVFVNRVPYDPFTDDERVLVRDLLAGKPPMLGERTMERIDRARVAMARLAHNVQVPILSLQDVWLESPRLAEEVASLMAVEGAT